MLLIEKVEGAVTEPDNTIDYVLRDAHFAIGDHREERPYRPPPPSKCSRQMVVSEPRP